MKFIDKLALKIKLYFYPPKVGDVYYGDPLDFILGSEMEKFMHGMKDQFGHSLWNTVPSKLCYKLTIETDYLSYYRCTSEVLTSNAYDVCEKKWLRRSQPRRIFKKALHKMIIDGKIEKL